MKVLVADDDPIARCLLQRLLTKWGHEAVLASDGLDAWQVLQSEGAPKLALLDCMMDGMDGLELVRKVRALAQPLPPFLILLSSLDSPEDIVRGLEAGANDYLTKPVRPQELRARVQVGARVLELQQCLANRVLELQTALDRFGRAEAENLRLAAAIEQASDGIVITDSQGSIQYANPAFTRITGYSRERVIGGNPRVLKSGRHAAEFYQNLWKTIGAGQVWNGEVVNRRADGTLYTEMMSITPIRGSDGSITNFIAIKQDVTERKAAVEAADRERSLLRALIDNLPDYIYVKDSESRFLVANDGTARLKGAAGPEELLGKTDFDFYPEEMAEQFRADERRVCDSGQPPIDCEEMARDAAGNAVWLLTTKVPFRNAQGEIEGVVGMGRDITRRKWAEEALRASEERFRQLAENIHEVFFLCEPNPPKVIYLSPAYEKLWGRPCQEVYDRPDAWIDAVHPEDREAGIAVLTEASQGARLDREYRIVRPDLAVRWIRVRTFPIFDAQGNFHRVVGTAEDITGRKQLEAELRQAQRLEAVGGLAAGIAHEINTPIQYVGDNIRFIRDSFETGMAVVAQYEQLRLAAQAGPVPPAMLARLSKAIEDADMDYLNQEIPKAVAQSLEGVERVATIVRAMKEFAHPGHKEKAAADLNKALSNALVVARNEIKYVADVETEFGEIPPLLWYIADLNQVFLNLLINAADAIREVTPKTGKKGLIRVRTECVADRAIISISDTGCGIPESIRGRVFDPFFTTKEVGRGSGQGLAIAYATIVEKHGGSIRFERNGTQGTTFVVSLPIETTPSCWADEEAGVGSLT